MSNASESTKRDYDLDELARLLREHVEIADRTYRFKSYPDCFVGEEACQWMVDQGVATDLNQAELIGDLLLEAGVFHHVLREHRFKNDYLFYRFAEDEDHGSKARHETGEELSWSTLLGSLNPSQSGAGLHPHLPDEIVLESADSIDEIGVEPMDDDNVELLDNVHPPAWINPEPEESYNMVVIGAGTGGLVTAAAVAGLGGKVALVEEHLMGGDCLNFGCVPSKVLIRAGRAVADIRECGRFGVCTTGEIEVDFEAVMKRLRAVRARISHHDSAERFARELGVDVFLGRARFIDESTVAVKDTRLSFSRACIATGASPALPPIPGLAKAPYLTNLTLFNLREQPSRMAIIGAGPIGCEMAQAFERLGTEVSLLDIQDRILNREDEDAARIVQKALEKDGVDLRLNRDINEVSHRENEDGSTTITLHTKRGESLEVDALLVASGRRPNVTDLGLEDAGVEYDERTGVVVDERLQTTNAAIYAVGDCATSYQFTHAADFMARIVVRNALFFGRQKFSDLLIPWCTYTDPGLAHVGLYAKDLEDRGIDFRTITHDLADNDRALIDGVTDGLIRIHVDNSATILGATVVSPHAGDLISEIAVAMRADMGLDDLANVIHPYPTVAGGIRATGDEYNRSRLTPTIQKLLRKILALRR